MQYCIKNRLFLYCVKNRVWNVNVERENNFLLQPFTILLKKNRLIYFVKKSPDSEQNFCCGIFEVELTNGWIETPLRSFKEFHQNDSQHILLINKCWSWIIKHMILIVYQFIENLV